MSVQFEVERFEWAADDRLELEGRWFGLRGRRFIRPTLDVEVDGEPRRLLALMEHKPWAAHDGEEWVAAFAWEGDRGEVAAELAVGPDLSFELPRPGGGTRRSAKKKTSTSNVAAPAQPARRARDDALERRLGEADRARAEAVAEAVALRRALDQKERTVRDLEETLARAREELAEARSAAAGAREELTPELDDLRRQLEAAVAARNAAMGHAEQAKRERYEAQGALAAAEREVQAVSGERDRARAEREELRTSASAARAERDAVRRERDAAASERDAALARLDDTRRERNSARLARDAVRAERPQVEGVAEVVRRRGTRSLLWLNRERTHDEMLALRFVALVALSVVCLLVAVWILVAA